VGIRLMRGQVVVRELVKRASVIWSPDDDPKSRTVKTHRGIVLQKGPPAFLCDVEGAPEVPHDFEVGDIVQFHVAHNLDAHTREWSDGQKALWLPQNAIDAVLE
jgi:hypothetical protein